MTFMAGISHEVTGMFVAMPLIASLLRLSNVLTTNEVLQMNGSTLGTDATTE